MPLREDESKTKKIIFTGVVLFVLISSVIGFTYSSISYSITTQNTNSKYGDYELFQTQFGFETIFENQPIEFFYLPEDLSSTDVSAVLNKLTSTRSYATSHPNSTFAVQISGAEFDIDRVLKSKHNTSFDVAFTTPNQFNKRVITCENATPLVPVIFFNFTNTTSNITENNDCVVINFESEIEFYRVRDKIIYELLEIRP